MSWEEVLLVDKLESVIDYRGKTPKKSKEGVITLSAKSVKMGYIDYSKAYHISEETYEQFMVRGFPKKGDVLMTTEAPLGCIAKLDREDVALAQRLLTFRANELELNNDYLMYFLMSPRGQYELKSRASGTTVQGIKKAEFVKVKILLPPLQTQKRIADILSAYDDLIENNLKRIKLLEEAAQNIYKEWFVHLRFPGYENTPVNEETELPEGWKNLKFGSVFNVQNGYAFKSKDYRDKGVPVLRTRDYSSSFLINISDPIFLPEEFSDSHKKYFVKELDFLLIMVGASIGKNGLVLKKDLPALQNQNQWAIRVKSEYSSYGYFKIYCVKSIIDSLLMKRTGAARDFFRASFIKEMDVQIPNEDVVKQFTKNVKPCIDQINLLLTQNQSLKAARDILLPRLMNRTIEV